MKQAVLASLFHCASNESRKLHDYCPVGPNSWCGYQCDRASYKHGPGLPLAVIAKVKPVYQRLSEDGLLQKCLHGKTQNRNESLNGMAKMCWNLASLMLFPILIWVHKLFYSCMMHFKFLQGSTLKMDVNSWMHTYKAVYKDRERNKKRRKALRGKKKRKEDKNQSTEGVTYAAGQF